MRAMPPLWDKNREEITDDMLPDEEDTPILNEVVRRVARLQAQKQKASFPAIEAKRAQLE